MAAPTPGEIFGVKGRAAGGAKSPGEIFGAPAAGAATRALAPAHKSGGLLGAIGKYSGADLVGHLAKDVATTAVGLGTGIPKLAEAAYQDVRHPLRGQNFSLKHPLADLEHPLRYETHGDPHGVEKQFLDPAIKQTEQYYGHDTLHHIYQHPLQALLDAATVADLGLSGAAKVGLTSADRAALVTRSPRAVATGRGPVHTDISSTPGLARERQVVVNRLRAKMPEGVKGTGALGELKQYGKQIQAEANQHAMSKLTQYEPYHKATKGLSSSEWAALHIRAMDIHPNDLAQLWKGTPAEKVAADPRIRDLALRPSRAMVTAEPAARALSEHGADLYRQKGLLKDETAAARPELTKKQAAEALGRPVKEITGKPYYFPHTMEQVRAASPLDAVGGGKALPKKLGSTKQNTGALALGGKLHLRSDVLGPEFLRRVKFVKYDEIHNALTRGAVRVTGQDVRDRFGGKLPQGWEYIREKPSTRIPPTMRGEGDQHIPIEKLIPNPDDLHDSQLAEHGFTTTDPGTAHVSGGRYYIVPKSTVKAATGEFTRSSNFVHTFVQQPLSVWRAAVLGLRAGFLTNNLVGNSVMYAAKTGGKGALRDLFGAILETHGRDVALRALRSQATPPELRADLYKEFFPEQVHGTFGRTQTPATSAAHVAGKTIAEGYRTATGALPRLTSKVAEEYPRRALIRNAIRNSPEFKRVYATLPKQTRNFENAARQILEGKGGAAYQRFVSKQVNDALGDYLNLSAVERNVLRNTLPFYAWYKAITTTTVHLAADTPLRANVLGQIGRIGKEQSDSALGDVPSFLEGALPLGAGKNGTTKVLSTQSINPYATLGQLERGATTDVTALGLNPFVQAAGDVYAKAKQGKGVSPAGLVSGALGSIVGSLPPVTLANPPGPSALYPNRNRKSLLWSYFGIPIKEYNPSVAAADKGKGY